MNRELPHASPNARSLRRALTLALVASPLAAQYGAIGLSGVGGQRFANEDIIFFEPQAGDRFGWVFATGDFNGDGADDLATGIPYDDGIVGFEIADCGAVVVRYGVPGEGLAGGSASTFLNQIGGGGPDPAEEGDLFGGTLAACDLDGDGFDELVVGVPAEDVGSLQDAGAVQVYRGAAGGLHATADRFLTQNTPGVPGDSESFENTGVSVACGDFDADGFADLAFGVEESLESDDAYVAGAVIVVHGSAVGLDTNRSYSIHQNSPGIEGTAEHWDLFGRALAVGDFDGDGYADLAVGVPGEDATANGPLAGRGAVQVVFGSASGLSQRDVVRAEGALGGVPQHGDRLGHALAAGDFDGDSFDDLAIGVPWKDVNLGGLAVDAGQIYAIYGAVGGFDFSRTALWTATAIHFPGASAPNESFGYSLAAGDFDRDGRDDLAIGEPWGDSVVPDDGLVNVLMGSEGGLSNARRHGLTSGYHGHPGVANQANRNYGFAVATGDFDGDGYVDLAVGAPYEGENNITDVGAAVVLYGSLFSDGLDVGNAGFWSQTEP
jgi:hypothetical protein